MADNNETGSTRRLYLRRKAMDLLARREHGFEELFAKLKRHLEEGEEALLHEVLDALREENLQDDERFVASFVRSRWLKGQGPRRISQELRQRGIPDQQIRDALEDESYDWRALCREVLERRFGSTRAASLSEMQRMQRFLAQRGFEGDDIRALTDLDAL